MPFEVKSNMKNVKEFETFFTELVMPVNDAIVDLLKNNDEFNLSI